MISRKCRAFRTRKSPSAKIASSASDPRSAKNSRAVTLQAKCRRTAKTSKEAADGVRSCRRSKVEGRRSTFRSSSIFDRFDMPPLHKSPNASSPLRLPSTLRATVWLWLKVKCDSPSFVEEAEGVDAAVRRPDVELAERAPEAACGR